MRYNPLVDFVDDWELVEIMRNGKRPCTDGFRKARDLELASIYRHLRNLTAAGHPTRPGKPQPTIQFLEKHKVGDGKTRVSIHVLKAKPSSWRLIYFPDIPRNRFVFLDSTSKKADRRDPKDLARAHKLIDALDRGDYKLVALSIPDH